MSASRSTAASSHLREFSTSSRHLALSRVDGCIFSFPDLLLNVCVCVCPLALFLSIFGFYNVHFGFIAAICLLVKISLSILNTFISELVYFRFLQIDFSGALGWLRVLVCVIRVHFDTVVSSLVLNWDFFTSTPA